MLLINDDSDVTFIGDLRFFCVFGEYLRKDYSLSYVITTIDVNFIGDLIFFRVFGEYIREDDSLSYVITTIVRTPNRVG